MENSKIEWTNATWNPLAGCTRASEGCDNCYAAQMALRLEAMAKADIAAGKDPGGKAKYIGIATKNGRGVPAFNGTINLDVDELQRPYTWKKPRMIFVNSMSDLFHKDVPEWFIFAAFNVMAENHRHTFQVLTKRPDRAAQLLSRYSTGTPPNVWIGTSVENQEQADKRIPALLTIPASVRFLSMEPLLGPVDFRLVPGFNKAGSAGADLVNGLWVIVGGESGPNARPMYPAWVDSILFQCQTAGVPFFFKQWGDSKPDVLDVRQWEFRGRDFSQKKGGRLLDGREWNEFPRVQAVAP